ncbi:hypothetical protein GVN24_33940 [Rhizobium sp. CRIBSB]|nr:hypothetical protein [Rhizobium sp. CRIBSB]
MANPLSAKASVAALIVVAMLALAFLFWPGQAFPASMIGLVALFPLVSLWLLLAAPTWMIGRLPVLRNARTGIDILLLTALGFAVVANVAWLVFAFSQSY